MMITMIVINITSITITMIVVDTHGETVHASEWELRTSGFRNSPPRPVPRRGPVSCFWS